MNLTLSPSKLPLWAKMTAIGFAITGLIGSGYHLYQKRYYINSPGPKGPQKEQVTPLLVVAKQLSEESNNNENIPTIEL